VWRGIIDSGYVAEVRLDCRVLCEDLIQAFGGRLTEVTSYDWHECLSRFALLRLHSQYKVVRPKT
jgi:hypothetical protein